MKNPRVFVFRTFVQDTNISYRLSEMYIFYCFTTTERTKTLPRNCEISKNLAKMAQNPLKSYGFDAIFYPLFETQV